MRYTVVFDRGEKFSHYQQFTSLQDYILVSQYKFWIEHHWRRGKQWEHTEFRVLEDTLSLTSIGCKISLNDIYRRVGVVD